MSRLSVAIVGTGIAGLGCAHFLHPTHDVTLFDGAGHAGGHSHTIDAPEAGRSVAFDTGFMVYNRVTYPRLTRLFSELGVPVKATDMSFSVQHLDSGLEYCGSSVPLLFSQRRNLWNLRFHRLLRQIHRFNLEAPGALDRPQWAEASVREYVERRGYGSDFLELFLVPMSAAVWSAPSGRMLEFPVTTLIRFFHNHGFLGLNTQHQWWTVDGGSRAYVQRLVEPLAGRLRLGDPVVSVRRLGPGGAEVRTKFRKAERFDRVILATHADTTLRLLSDADSTEHGLLSQFPYQSNLATVHTDSSVMPRARRAWSAWNYRVGSSARGNAPSAQTIYWMNALQGVSDRVDYFVSINEGGTVAPEKILRRIPFEHPIFSLGGVKAQRHLPDLNRREAGQSVFFCGSYFRYGFHEDAFSSAVDLCEQILGVPLGWPGIKIE